MAGFEYVKALDGACKDHNVEHIEMAPSITITKGDALKLDANSALALADTTDVVSYVAAETMSSSATGVITGATDPDQNGDPAKPAVISTANGTAIFRKHKPELLVDEVDTTVAGTTTTLSVAMTATADQLIGGTVYCKDRGEQRRIIDNDATGDVETGEVLITVLVPFSRATAIGDTISVLPYGMVDKTVQLEGASDVESSIAGLSSGKLTIRKVDMKRKETHVTFNAS